MTEGIWSLTSAFTHAHFLQGRSNIVIMLCVCIESGKLLLGSFVMFCRLCVQCCWCIMFSINKGLSDTMRCLEQCSPLSWCVVVLPTFRKVIAAPYKPLNIYWVSERSGSSFGPECSDLYSSKLRKVFIKWLWFFLCILQFIIVCKCFFVGGLTFSNQTEEGQSQILTGFTDYVHVWLSSLLLTTHFHAILLFSSSHLLISPAALHSPPPPPPLLPSQCVVNLISELQEQMCRFQEEISTRIQEKRALEEREAQQGEPRGGQAWGPSPAARSASSDLSLCGSDTQRNNGGQNVHVGRLDGWTHLPLLPHHSFSPALPLLTSPHATRYLDISTESN